FGTCSRRGSRRGAFAGDRPAGLAVHDRPFHPPSALLVGSTRPSCPPCDARKDGQVSLCAPAPRQYFDMTPTPSIARLQAPTPRYTSYPTAPHFTEAVGAEQATKWIASLPD